MHCQNGRFFVQQLRNGMGTDKNIIEQLLYEAEGPSLDFKRDQYRFEGVSDDEKGELLKGILSMANAWRRSDAYI